MFFLPSPITAYIQAQLRMPRALLFLLRRGTHTIPHAHGSLFAHLVGTYVELGALCVSRDVRLAGLMHSIYGTSVFTRGTVPISQRSTVAALIGVQAERLVFLFSQIDRPRVWDELTRESTTIRLRSGVQVPISSFELVALAQIEYANLLDQMITPPQKIRLLSGT